MVKILLLSGLFTWGMTAAGASLVFFLRKIKPIYLDGMLGFSAGIMITASFTSLILPAIEYAEGKYTSLESIVIVCLGIMSGTLILMVFERIIPNLHPNLREVSKGGSDFKRVALLVTAITLHNIPEGLAVGVAYGAYAATGDQALLAGAISLAIGIGMQNFPEGSAVSFPLLREGVSKPKSFFIGQLSAVVEPIMIFVGFYLVKIVEGVLPFLLALAAGAMLFVVIEELIPESQTNSNVHIITIFTIIGLITMLFLDVLLG